MNIFADRHTSAYDSTQRTPVPLIEPKRMHIELPEAHPDWPTISVTCAATP
jgi:hypothetical protein